MFGNVEQECPKLLQPLFVTFSRFFFRSGASILIKKTFRWTLINYINGGGHHDNDPRRLSDGLPVTVL